MQFKQSKNIQQWIEEQGFLVNPTGTVLREVAESLVPGEGVVQILIDKETLRSIDREYTTASKLAVLEREGVIEFRALSGEYQTNLVVTNDVTGAFIDLKSLTVAIGAEDDEIIEKSCGIVEELWETAEACSLRTPPHDEVEERFDSHFDSKVYDDFVRAVTVMEQAALKEQLHSEPLFSDRQHTYASVLVSGAVNESSLRELGRCVEYCGLASRSTLSRLKQGIEDAGYITTTPIETTVGRPPMRLSRSELYTGDDTELLAERVYEYLQGEDGENDSEENVDGS